MKFSALTVDIKAQEEGDWRDHPYFKGVRVCVRSSESDFVQRKHDAFVAALPRIEDRTEEDNKRLTEQLTRIRKAALLAGWEGIEDESDEPIPYSDALAYEWAGRDAVSDGRRVDPRFYEGVVLLADGIGRDEQKAVKKSQGNSPRRSRSSSNSRSSTRATAST